MQKLELYLRGDPKPKYLVGDEILKKYEHGNRYSFVATPSMSELFVPEDSLAFALITHITPDNPMPEEATLAID